MVPDRVSTPNAQSAFYWSLFLCNLKRSTTVGSKISGSPKIKVDLIKAHPFYSQAVAPVKQAKIIKIIVTTTASSFCLVEWEVKFFTIKKVIGG